MKKVYVKKWAVPSDTRRKRYIVSLTPDGRYECSCAGWIFRHKDCRHIKMVKENPHMYEEIDVGVTGIIVDIADSLKG